MPPRRNRDLKEEADYRIQAINDIKSNIAEYGIDAGPRLARKNYTEVPRSTWYKWLEDAKASPIERSIAAAKKAAKHLPVSPPPEYMSERPVESRKNINYMAQIDALMSDANMLREYSMGKNARGEEVIRSAKIFDRSISLRIGVLESAVKTLSQIYEFKRMQHFYDMIVEEIMKESPETAERIVARLQELDNVTGITINARA